MHAVIPLVKQRTTAWHSVRVGPKHHGRRMPLQLFVRAEATAGYHYELANGVVQATDIPGMTHNWILDELEELIRAYKKKNTGVIQYIAGGDRAKIELWGRESERHPDFSIYLTPPPAGVEQPWDRWMPEIVVEVVSASSAKRDYDEKPDDYLAAGVKEYWIIDPVKKRGLFLTRRGDSWLKKRVGRRGTWTTGLLPKFKLDLGRVFERATKRK